MIEHEGIIEQVKGGSLIIRILQQSACITCNAKDFCAASESKEKLVKITNFKGTYQINEKVIVTGSESIGHQAVMWAYIIPFFIMLLAAILTITVWNLPEVQSALIAILSLIPYYIFVFLIKNKLTKKFNFSVKKADL